MELLGSLICLLWYKGIYNNIMTHMKDIAVKSEHRTLGLSELENFVSRKDKITQKVISMYIVGYEFEEIADECNISLIEIDSIIESFADEIL